MQVRTENLIGLALDWAVAIAQGAKTESQSGGQTWLVDGAMLGYVRSYNPSTDWAQGGPLIDRYGIGVYREAESSCTDDGWTYAEGETWEAIIGIYYVGEHEGRCQGLRVKGPTALVAAMRALVESTLGDEVEVPDELA